VNLDSAAHIAMPGRSTRVSAYFDQIDYLKCYAIALVVIVHVSAPGAYQWTPVPGANWWLASAFNAFARTCVPLFLMASGATLLDAAKVEPVGQFLTRRVRRIIVPLMFWSLVYLADREWLIGEHLTIGTVTRYLISGATFYHLPFFYYLFGLYLSAPVLARFAERTSTGTLLYFIVIWGTAACVQLASDLSGVASGVAVPVIAGFAGYFALGRMLRDTAVGGRTVLVCLTIIAIGWLATLLGTYRLTAAAGHLNELFFEYTRPNVAAMSIASYLVLVSTPVQRFAKRNPRITYVLRQIAGLSFGIYLVHPLLLQVLIPRLHIAWNTGGALIGIPAMTIVTLAISALVVWVLRQSSVTRITVS
jgi:surface polysaccharide O-acyltransferase-like enzyme